MKQSEWIVTLTEKAPMASVTRRLEKMGFSVKEKLTEIRCVTGSATPAVAEQIRHLDGVADIAPNSEMHIDPPENGPTW